MKPRSNGRTITSSPTLQNRHDVMRARLAAIVRSSADAIVGETLDGIITDWNPAAERLYGYAAEEVIGQPVSLLIPPELMTESTTMLARVRNGESIEDVETYRWTKDGGRVDVSLTVSPVWNEDGEIIATSAIVRDITARKAAEVEQAETHQHTRQVLERITDGFYALDRAFRFTYVNAAAEQMLGRTREELLGKNLWEAFPPVIETPLYAAYHEALATNIPVTFEFYYPPFDHWIEVRVFPAADGLSVFFRDITEGRQLTQTLRDSEAKYRALVDHLPVVVYALAVDDAQTRTYFSPRHEVLTGFPRAETLANPEHWLNLVHPDDRVRVAAENNRAEAHGDPFRAEYRLRRKDGSYVWVRDEAVPVRDDAGAIFSWQGVLLDITERVQAEEGQARLAAIVESAEDGILSCTLDGTITSWNHGAEKLFGYNVDEAMGRDVAMLRPPELADDISCLMEGVRQGASIEGHETVRLTRDGRRVNVSLSISPLRDVNGRVTGIASISRDITALRATEAALRLRDRALAATANGILITDPKLPDNPIVDANPAFEVLTGYSRDEVVGRSARMLYGPETDPAAAERVREAILAGDDITETMLTYRKDGTSFWSHHNVAAVRDDAGNLTHFVGVVTDVTQRVESEAALAQERDLLQTLLEHLPDAVYIKDTASRFLRINLATARELRIADPAEAIGKTDRDFLPKSMAEKYLSDERRLLETGEPMLNQLEQRHGQKEPRWVLATKVPLRDSDGDIVGLVGVNRDITDRLNADETRARLAAIIESAEDAIISRTLDGTITSWNRGAEKLYGYRADEAIGRLFTMLLPDEERLTGLAEAERFGTPATQFEARRRRQDGTLVDVSIAMSPIRNDDGVTIGVSTITRDITNLKRLEHDLRSALETAQAAMRTKSLFLAMMSHELRTPLQAVLGYADFLLLGTEDSLTTEQREDLGYIRGGATRMIALIDQMLDLSRMEAGRLDLVEEPVDLVEIIEQVRQDVAPQAGAKGLQLHFVLPETLPLVVGDAHRVRQILLNLVGNAVKFTEQGSVSISAHSNADGVDIDVTDTGIGITAEAMPMIFEEFRQVDGNLTRRFGGAGLGLAIAKRLAEQMGGAITVVSTPNSGSTFTLRLVTARPARGRRDRRRGSRTTTAIA